MIWDGAGRIWSDLSNDFKLQSTDVVPNLIKFTIDEEFEVSIGIEKSSIVWFQKDKAAKNYYHVCSRIIEVCKKYLEIKNYNRLGERILLLEKTETTKDASEKLHKYNLIKKFKGEFFNIKGEQPFGDCAIKWEDEDIGTTVRLSVFDQTLNINTQPMFSRFVPATEIQKEIKISGVLYDVDYFTKKKVSAAQLKADEWLKQAVELIENDLDKFLVS